MDTLRLYEGLLRACQREVLTELEADGFTALVDTLREKYELDKETLRGFTADAPTASDRPEPGTPARRSP